MLGSTRLGGSCDVQGLDPDAERCACTSVEALQIFVADEFGRWAGQVEWWRSTSSATLGMAATADPGDLMYEVVRDRVLVREGLSTEA